MISYQNGVEAFTVKHKSFKLEKKVQVLPALL